MSSPLKAETSDVQGFYKWVDTVVQVNSEANCMVNVATNYIVMHVSCAKFMRCQKTELDTCFGPFLKEEGI